MPAIMSLPVEVRLKIFEELIIDTFHLDTDSGPDDFDKAVPPCFGNQYSDLRSFCRLLFEKYPSRRDGLIVRYLSVTGTRNTACYDKDFGDFAKLERYDFGPSQKSYDTINQFLDLIAEHQPNEGKDPYCPSAQPDENGFKRRFFCQPDEVTKPAKHGFFRPSRGALNFMLACRTFHDEGTRALCQRTVFDMDLFDDKPGPGQVFDSDSFIPPLAQIRHLRLRASNKYNTGDRTYHLYDQPCGNPVANHHFTRRLTKLMEGIKWGTHLKSLRITLEAPQAFDVPAFLDRLKLDNLRDGGTQAELAQPPASVDTTEAQRHLKNTRSADLHASWANSSGGKRIRLALEIRHLCRVACEAQDAQNEIIVVPPIPAVPRKVPADQEHYRSCFRRRRFGVRAFYGMQRVQGWEAKVDAIKQEMKGMVGEGVFQVQQIS